MPFQSEKQRKYLHANHPEIAKRWEKEYATGGISNLFKNRTGFHRGSTRHQLTHDYKAYAKPSDYFKWAPPSLQISPEVWNPERDAMQTTMKERFMYGEPTPKKEDSMVKSDMDKAINAWLKELFTKKKRNEHATGGVSNLFKLKEGGRIGYEGGLKVWGKSVDEQWDNLNEDQKKYIRENFPDQVPEEAAQGGLIPAHEAGIYGLAEGGNIRLQPHTASDLLVQETSSGERPKYQPPGHVDAPAPSSPSTSGGGGDEPSWGGESYDPPSAPPAETVERDDGDAREKYISEQYKVPKQIDDPDYDEPDRAHEKLTQREIKQRIKELKSSDQYGTRLTREQKKQVNAELAAYYGDKPGTKYDLADWGADKAWGQKKSGIWGMLGKGILTFATAGAGAGLFGKDIAKAASLYNKYKQGKRIKTAWDEGKFKIAKKEFDISNLKNKLKSADQKLIVALPKGHPERIQKEGLKKETPDDVHERENGQIQETKPTITMDVEAVNDANAEKARLLRKYQEMEWAAYRAKLEQQEMEAKKQAWLRQLRQTYMSAQGGRVPQGYNTGGLSNLFKLKNV